MRAKFELEYTGKSGIDVFSQVDVDVESDQAKLDFIEAVAGMLGICDRVSIRKPLAEEMWDHEGNEAHE